MKHYDFFMSDIIKISTAAGAGNAQFFDIKYVFEKMAHINPHSVKHYGEQVYRFYQKEVKEIINEIKSITGTKTSKKAMLELCDTLSKETSREMYRRHEG